MTQSHGWRTPCWTCRVMLTCAVLALPGALAGAGVSVFAGDFFDYTALGAVAGVLLGAWIEAGSAAPPDAPAAGAPDALDAIDGGGKEDEETE